MGPTASGKTDLAMRLRRNLPVEIISVDSALIYKDMDIGTAKPSKAELALAPHRLIDIIDPAHSYSAANFRSDALREMAQISAQGKIPLLVGGTMLYYKALAEGISPLPQADEKLRRQIEDKAQRYGWPALHRELSEIDPISAQRINPNDSQRINRALEVFYLSGKSLTELIKQKRETPPYHILQFSIEPQQRSLLHQRIEQRFYTMLELGFQQEVEKLYQRSDLHPDLPSIRCVGYRQMWEYLRGDYSREEMIFRAICATRQLAKRQITWLRGWKAPLCRLDSQKSEEGAQTIEQAVDLAMQNQ